MAKQKSIVIDGVTYVPEGTEKAMAAVVDGMKYVICRTYSAGVYAAYLESKDGEAVVLRNARKLWYWSGAASLSQLATEGVKNPKYCKFPCEVDRVELPSHIEIIDCTEEARLSIKNTPVWAL